MNMNSAMTEKQTWTVIQAISKNEWCGTHQDIRLDAWSNFQGAPDALRNYLCKDGSGYVRGFYDGAGIFYVLKFHLRDDEWTSPQSTPQ